jgi:hypothetical protein
MTMLKCYRVMRLALLGVACLFVSAHLASAQNAGDEKANLNIGIEVRLQLIVGTNQAVEDEKLPPELDAVIKQLRSSLPFKHYHLAASLLNRVKNRGRLGTKWVGSPLLPLSGRNGGPASVNDLSITAVMLDSNATGQPLVAMLGFTFQTRIRFEMSQPAADGTPSGPAWQERITEWSGDTSVREGEPAVVGTLNIGPSGDAILLVVTAKRTQP